MISRPRSLKPLRIYKLTVGGVIPRQWRHSLELPPLLQGVDIQRFASGHRTNRWRYARIETSEYGIQYHPQFRTKVRREHKNIQTPCVFCSQFWIFSGLLGTKMLFFRSNCYAQTLRLPWVSFNAPFLCSLFSEFLMMWFSWLNLRLVL